MAQYFYYPVPQKLILQEEETEYVSYGISVFQILEGSAREIHLVSDVSLDRDFAFTLAHRCTVKQLAPVHLLDVIQDTLY